MEMRLSKLREIVKDREAWRAAVRGIAQSWTWLSHWTTIWCKQWNKIKQDLGGWRRVFGEGCEGLGVIIFHMWQYGQGRPHMGRYQAKRERVHVWGTKRPVLSPWHREALADVFSWLSLPLCTFVFISKHTSWLSLILNPGASNN